MEIKNELRSVGNEQSVGTIETLRLQLVELFEKGREVYHDAVSDQPDAVRVHHTCRKKRESLREPR